MTNGRSLLPFATGGEASLTMSEDPEDPIIKTREDCRTSKCAAAWADYHEVRGEPPLGA